MENTHDEGRTQEHVQHILRTIEALNPSLNALLQVHGDAALERARELDRHVARTGGPIGVLHGMSVTVKDNVDIAGHATTAASPMRTGMMATANAPVVDRLLQAGAVIVGKANMHEWAFGPTSQSRHFGPVANPWDRQRVPGGSSGGSAVAVACGMCVASIGTDTGGSVRIPAAFNGVTGLRPTIGRVSTRGSLPVSRPFDTLGPMARTAWDVARVFSAIAGHDAEDPNSVDRPLPDILTSMALPVRNMRVGVMRRWFFDDIDAEVRAAVDRAIGVLRDIGVEIVEVDLGQVERAREMFNARVLSADALHEHESTLADASFIYGDDIRTRLQMGARVTGAAYAQALRWIEDLRHRLREGIFNQVDACLAPTVKFAAPSIHEIGNAEIVRDIFKFTAIHAAAGSPAIALPCGFSADGLPLSFELAGGAFEEARILRLAHAFQRVTDFHLRRPPLGAA